MDLGAGCKQPLGGSGRAPSQGDPGDRGTGRSLLLTDSGAASSQPGGILVEKAHSSLLCQEGRTSQGCPAVPWDMDRGTWTLLTRATSPEEPRARVPGEEGGG